MGLYIVYVKLYVKKMSFEVSQKIAANVNLSFNCSTAGMQVT